VIVVDACAWVRALVDNGARGDAARELVLADQRWAAPAHMPLEVMRTLHRGVLSGELTRSQATSWARFVAATEVELVSPDDGMLSRVWTLGDTISIYDGAYVAVAEAYDVPLVTADARLARAARARGVDAVVPGEQR